MALLAGVFLAAGSGTANAQPVSPLGQDCRESQVDQALLAPTFEDLFFSLLTAIAECSPLNGRKLVDEFEASGYELRLVQKDGEEDDVYMEDADHLVVLANKELWIRPELLEEPERAIAALGHALTRIGNHDTLVAAEEAYLKATNDLASAMLDERIKQQASLLEQVTDWRSHLNALKQQVAEGPIGPLKREVDVLRGRSAYRTPKLHATSELKAHKALRQAKVDNFAEGYLNARELTRELGIPCTANLVIRPNELDDGTCTPISRNQMLREMRAPDAHAEWFTPRSRQEDIRELEPVVQEQLEQRKQVLPLDPPQRAAAAPAAAPATGRSDACDSCATLNLSPEAFASRAQLAPGPVPPAAPASPALSGPSLPDAGDGGSESDLTGDEDSSVAQALVDAVVDSSEAPDDERNDQLTADLAAQQALVDQTMAGHDQAVADGAAYTEQRDREAAEVAAAEAATAEAERQRQAEEDERNQPAPPPPPESTQPAPPPYRAPEGDDSADTGDDEGDRTPPVVIDDPPADNSDLPDPNAGWTPSGETPPPPLQLDPAPEVDPRYAQGYTDADIYREDNPHEFAPAAPAEPGPAVDV